MSARSIEIEVVPGFHSLIHERFLRTPDSRMVPPNTELLDMIGQAGQVFITAASREPENREKVVYCAFQWPEKGPVHLGLIWARNPMREVDAATGKPFFMCAFSETQDEMLTYDEAQLELSRYAVGHLGKPTLVT
jgi:hypothetical protein